MKLLKQATLFLAIGCFLCTSSVLAQSTQTIKGFVRDRDTKRPLTGAIIKIVNLEDKSLGTVSNDDGSFRLPSVPVGRIRIECAFLGYDSYVSEDLVLNSAKALDLEIELIQAVVLQNQVVISAIKHRSEPLNELSIVSARSFTPEETNRYAATANDVGRMAMGFPGVQVSNDDSNGDIIIRGNSGIASGIISIGESA